ncbi:hypothetical protein DOTSEDRAFT_174781 [Dothistroma septosporum NZE10]|uniref:Sucrose transporter-like protein n=1 Tax=Dothistroma septosporum (strain NZE10 / CBS 128990) TaxID=675120 RepID=N1PHY2_DOTSN|nr:hypothetical protein DOTSEDRAFT_174781 [Dothistroma septosporum NZE10]
MDRHSTPSVDMPSLLLLTCPSFGVQMLWLVMMAYGTPYLNDLGVSTSASAMVWLSGPLSGTIAQPLFAALSDNCQHRWGKRRPFIAGGAICAALALLGLASTEDIVGFFTPPDAKGGMAMMMGGPKSSSPMVRLLVIFWACTLSLAMQPIQCGLRALLVDSYPERLQSVAAALGTGFSGLGAVCLSGLASIDLPARTPLFGETPFKALSVVAVAALACTVIPVCLIGHDLPARTSNRAKASSLSSILRTMRTLPPTTRRVCRVQFTAWLGWFALLYYSTTYVFEAYVFENHVHLKPEVKNYADGTLIQIGKAAGRRSSFVFASVTLITTILLLVMIRDSARKTFTADAWRLRTGRIWQISHGFLAALMFLTTFVRTTWAATMIVGCVAMSWAVTQWAPYALICSEVATLRQPTRDLCKLHSSHEGEGGAYDEEDAERQVEHGTALIMAVHNMAISMPQVLAAVVCSALFKAVSIMGRYDPATFAFKLAGLMAALASYQARSLS